MTRMVNSLQYHAEHGKNKVKSDQAKVALETYFADGRSDTATLEDLLASAAEVRASLRFSHLSSHLAARDVLTGTQVERYNRLRGYRD